MRSAATIEVRRSFRAEAIAGLWYANNSGNQYVLVAMDYFSKWQKIHAIPNQETNTIVSSVVNNRVCRDDFPKDLHSETEISKQPHSGICVRNLVQRDLNDVASPTVRRNNRTVSSYLGGILAKSNERATEGLG